MKANLKLLAAGLLGAVSAATLSSAAFADPVAGPYLQLGFGDQYATPTGSAEFKLGQAYGGEGGWSFGNGFRTDLELGYLTGNIDKYHHARPGGKLHETTVLLNGIYDFDQVQLFGFITPHVGLGAGYGAVHGRGGLVPGSIGGNRAAVQGIIGLEMPITSAIKFDIDYRPLYTPNVSFRTAAGSSKGNIFDNNLFFSIRFDFASPPAAPAPAPAAPPPPAPAPAPAPAPEAQRAFQVFFDFDKSAITPDAASIISQAAQTALAGHITSIKVTGHTDTVGTVKYNQKLSERRAAAVKAELIKDGMPTDEISTLGVGKTGLLVPTPDGVREPQNRRAEIELQ